MQGVCMYQAYAKYRAAASTANLFVSFLPVVVCIYSLSEGRCLLSVCFC